MRLHDRDCLRLSVDPSCVLLRAALVATSATTDCLPADFAEMVAGRRLIVHGTVVDVRAQTTAGRRSIESIVTVAVRRRAQGHRRGARSVFRVPADRSAATVASWSARRSSPRATRSSCSSAGGRRSMPMPFGLSQGVYRVDPRRRRGRCVTPRRRRTAPAASSAAIRRAGRCRSTAFARQRARDRWSARR